MKLINSLALATLLFISTNANAQTLANADQHKVHHVVIVWLKQHGDVELKQQYINASKPLAEIDGVLAYDIGEPVSIKRERPNPAVDDSYDLAISATYQSQQAYESFLKNPEYQHLAVDVLRPLVEKYKVYDFVE